MVHCARCPASFHQSCLPSVEHIQFSARTLLCARCFHNTPKGLNAPDREMPRRRGEPERESEEEEEPPAAPGLSLASFGATKLKFGKRAEVEFTQPEENLAALRAREVIPAAGFGPPRYIMIRRSVYCHGNERERLEEQDIIACNCDSSTGLCYERCPTRALQQECNATTCPHEQCGNRQFGAMAKLSPAESPLQLFKTLGKGWGVKSLKPIAEGDLVVEYVGEVIDKPTWNARKASLGRFEHMYFMALNGNEIVDASRRGNIARFVNHSCDPNMQVEKWYVNRQPRLGFFAKRDIGVGEELCYNYSVKWSGDPEHAQPCHCGAANCTGFLGVKPKASPKKSAPKK